MNNCPKCGHEAVVTKEQRWCIACGKVYTTVPEALAEVSAKPLRGTDAARAAKDLRRFNEALKAAQQGMPDLAVSMMASLIRYRDRTIAELDELLISREADAEKMRVSTAKVVAENDKLRKLLADGSDPCVYCQLPKADMAKCTMGFPGCSRADDMQPLG